MEKQVLVTLKETEQDGSRWGIRWEKTLTYYPDTNQVIQRVWRNGQSVASGSWSVKDPTIKQRCYIMAKSHLMTFVNLELINKVFGPAPEEV